MVPTLINAPGGDGSHSRGETVYMSIKGLRYAKAVHWEREEMGGKGDWFPSSGTGEFPELRLAMWHFLPFC